MFDPSRPSFFPNGRLAAVSLTYDDGLEAHLDTAIPELDAAGLRGTFFIPTRIPMGGRLWTDRAAEWKSAAGRGHELANHTQYHPCSADWVKPNFRLEAYSLRRMESELVGANADLAEVLGVEAPRSFAFPCSQEVLGPDGESFRPAVERLFPAARTGGRRKVIDPMTVDFAAVPSWQMNDKLDADDLSSFLDDAVHSNGWAVVHFHGVGGGHAIDVPSDLHRAVCKELATRNEEIWCDTFLNVAQHLRTVLHRPWR